MNALSKSGIPGYLVTNDSATHHRAVAIKTSVHFTLIMQANVTHYLV